MSGPINAGPTAGQAAGSLRLAVGYGGRATWRRRRLLLLPVVTVATGAFLVVLVMALMPSVRAQGAALGDANGIGRAAVAIAVVVLLVGAFEVAIAATRSVTQRAAEIGVLATFGVAGRCTLAALLVEPLAVAAVGSAAGAVVGVGFGFLTPSLGLVDTPVQPGDMALGLVLAIAVSVVAAAAASAAPTLRAVRRPPLASLSH